MIRLLLPIALLSAGSDALAAPGDCPIIEPVALDLPSLTSTSEVAATGDGGLRVVLYQRRDDEAVVPGVEVQALGPDGTVRTRSSDAAGRILWEDLPAGLYTLLVRAPQPVTIQDAKVTAGRTSHVSVSVDWDEPSAMVDPGDPPSPTTWVRYSRSACLGPCPIFEVTLDHGGGLLFDGQDFVHRQGRVERTLTSKQQDALAEAVACARGMPSFSARHATDHPTTRLEVWEADGSRWSWVWHGADFRAPYDELERFRRQLERAMGVARWH